MADMGTRFAALFVVSLALMPGLARAQATPPVGAFPPPGGTAPAPPGSAPPPPPASAPPTPGGASPAVGAAGSAPPPPAATSPAPPAAATPPAPPVAAGPPLGQPTNAAPAPYPYAYPPPPPGYTYGYYYPPAPPPAPPLRFANDAAVSSSPFFDAVVLVADWQHRVSDSVNLGAQAGAYVGGRVRVTAKIAFPTEGMGDREADFGSGSKDPSFFYAFSAGFAAVRTPTFVLSPGLMFARTDVADYGTMLGLALPLDWVTKSGLRLGLEGGFGRAFGGRRSVPCSTDCNQPPRFQDREPGVALWLQFQIGFGFNHPAPLPPAAGPPP
jgi:hypothetical protein